MRVLRFKLDKTGEHYEEILRAYFFWGGEIFDSFANAKPLTAGVSYALALHYRSRIN